jgi:NTP pyrophosphatase (non-canonical NTP hydrolase)
MKIHEYQKAVRRTINNDLSVKDQILNFSLGLSGEVGEVIDLIKKEFFQGHKRNNDKLKDEIGDVFWYLTNLCNELGYDIETVLDMNIEKLNKRYPNGFKKEDSENRDKSIKVMLKVIDNYVRERNNIKEKYNDLKLEMSDEDEELIREKMNKQLESCKCNDYIKEICNLLTLNEIKKIGGSDGLNKTIKEICKYNNENEISAQKHIFISLNMGERIEDIIKNMKDEWIGKNKKTSFTLSEKHYPGKDLDNNKEEDWKDVNDVY